MRAYIYGRYSSHSQKDTSIEQQFRDIYDYCKRSGIKIMGEYADRALTGKTDKRPEFQKMIKDCAKGHVKLIVCWKVDRFARNRYDAAMYKARLKKYGVRVDYAKESIPEGPEGILLESILEGSAEYYSANLSQNVRRGMMENARECKVNNGGLPLGYKKGDDGKYAIEPIGAAIVKDVFSMYTQGMSITEICADLNARGCRTSKGALFNKSSLRVMLRNERYKGIYKYAEVRIEDGIPRIITDEVFNMAQNIIARNAKAPAGSKNDVDYLLTGKLFCGHCGSAMVGESGVSKTGRRHYYYACTARKRKKSCNKKSAKKDWLEEFVVKATVEQVLTDDMINIISDSVIELQEKERKGGDIPIIQTQISENNKLINNVMKAIEMGIITETTKNRLNELEDRKRELGDSLELAKISLTNFSKAQIVFWLRDFKNGDINSQEYRQKVIEIFVNSVYLYDDKIKIVYNYSKDGANTVDMAFIESMDTEVEEFGYDAHASTI